MTASQIKNLGESKIKDRNPQDHSPVFQSQAFSENSIFGTDPSVKINHNDRESVIDNVAANKNKLLIDPSKQKGSSWKNLSLYCIIFLTNKYIILWNIRNCDFIPSGMFVIEYSAYDYYSGNITKSKQKNKDIYGLFLIISATFLTFIG